MESLKESFYSGFSNGLVWATAITLFCYVISVSRLRNYVLPNALRNARGPEMPQDHVDD